MFKWQCCSYSQKPSRLYECNAVFELQCVQPEASGSFGNSVTAWNWSLSATLVEQVKSENNYQGSVALSNCVKPLNMPALQLADIACNCLKWDSAQNKEQHCFPLKCLESCKNRVVYHMPLKSYSFSVQALSELLIQHIQCPPDI